MNHRELITVAVISTGIFLLLLFYLTRRFRHRPTTQPQQQTTLRSSSLQNSINILQQQPNIFTNNNSNNNKRRTNYYVLRRGTSKAAQPLFSWADNPSLVTDAVESGWSRFAFANFASSPTVQSKPILGYCGPVGDGTDSHRVEISWEVCEGTSEFMQKIRMNPGLKKVFATAGPAAASVIKSALPLPGPALGNLTPFPQEAYFEITILPSCEDESENEMNGRVGANKEEGEKIKLIKETPSESLVHVTSNGVSTRGGFDKGEELRCVSGGNGIVEGGMETGVVMTLGLAAGGSLPVKVPGSYSGSIGFNSDGSVYLEGVKLTSELECDAWGKVEKVIGCGYNPSQKKVYFTVDGKFIREVYCRTEEFETPLYPILAANSSVTILVNFGQSIFKYTQANLHRTPNPCFIGQAAGSPILGFEDSRELFSMGRIDAHWLDRSTKRNAQYFGSVNRGMSDYDESSEGDLFEIVLDNNSRGRSPSMHF